MFEYENFKPNPRIDMVIDLNNHIEKTINNFEKYLDNKNIVRKNKQKGILKVAIFKPEEFEKIKGFIELIPKESRNNIKLPLIREYEKVIAVDYWYCDAFERFITGLAVYLQIKIALCKEGELKFPDFITNN